MRNPETPIIATAELLQVTEWSAKFPVSDVIRHHSPSCLLPKGLHDRRVAGCGLLQPHHPQYGILVPNNKLLCMDGSTERETNQQPHSAKNSLKAAALEALSNINMRYLI